jgi:membrane protein implicated in regulation of membrane protease activity
MDMQPWLMWVFIAAIFAVIEMLTFGLVMIWFAVGAGVAALLAYFGVHPGYQWAAFAVVTILLLIFTRKIAHKITANFPKGIGAERFVSMTGVVIEDIDPESNKGRVRVGTDEWRALTHTGEKISSGTRIEVLKVEGTRLVVKEVK